MNGFKMGNFCYLIATDDAARGSDIDNVTLIINCNVPTEGEGNVHRTGRSGNEGKTITFATPYEGKFLRTIEKYIDFEIPKVEAPLPGEVTKYTVAFEEKISARRVVKNNRTARVNKNITEPRFTGGKRRRFGQKT